MSSRFTRPLLVAACLLGFIVPATAAQRETTEPLARLQRAATGAIDSHRSARTGELDFLRAERGAVLVTDGGFASPETRARAFLAEHGDAIGMDEAERRNVAPRDSRTPIAMMQTPATGSELRVNRIDTDAIGETHVRMNQFFRGVPVFGVEVIVHMNGRGITGVNGAFVPQVDVDVTPQLDAYQAMDLAQSMMVKVAKRPANIVGTPELTIYRKGLVEGYEGESVLAWIVDTEAGRKAERVILDARSGEVLLRYPLHHSALYRKIYTPTQNESDLRRKEGDAATFIPPVDNLYDFAADSYNFFKKAFHRDSYDGNGAKMHSVYLVDQNICPNAYWSTASDSTNYCPGFDADDVVSHEWGHAYTSYTHNLIYAYQSGALNESYSDIWGETVDLHNGRDTLVGGTNNTQTYPLGQRWVIGEDVVGPAHNELLTRDMWDPERLGSPAKVGSPNYACGTGDYGGVHTNSGVSNHAYVMLADGKTFNGQTVGKIGFTKAINIYWRAAATYQVPTSNFADHEKAILTSCTDLIGKALSNFSTGLPSTEVINSNDCAQVAKAMKAVEMGVPPSQCNYQPLLKAGAPPICVRNSTVFADDFETGLDGWTLEHRGQRNVDWRLASNLPQGRAGSAAFAPDLDGVCAEPGTAFSMTSPTFVAPPLAAGEKLLARFDHLVETEFEWDGGNVKISVNGGAFTILPQSAFVFNAPNGALLAAADDNTNPKAGEIAFHGADGGSNVGSWGTTVIDLTSLVQPGDSVAIQFDFGFDGCTAITGWFVDNFTVYSCPAVNLTAPTLAPVSDDAAPDQSGGVDHDGSFTLTWSHDDGEPACGYRVEEAKLIAPASFSDDASEVLIGGSNARWNGSPTWHTSNHPTTATTGYSVLYTDNLASSLTMKSGFAIPEGAGAVLTFDSFEDVEDGFDFVNVDVSTNNGATFQRVFSASGVFSGKRSINLSAFEGETILIRFQIAADIYFSFPLYQGWSIDNVELRTTDKYASVATVDGSVRSYSVTGRGNGAYSYRVVGLFGNCSGDPNVGPESNVQQIAVTLIPSALPTASFTANPNPAEVNANVMFDGSASIDNDSLGAAPAIVRYRWSFGDGATATTSTPSASHAYSAAGTYRVALTVTDNDGETATTEQDVQIFEIRDGQAVGGGSFSVNGEKSTFGFDVARSGGNTSGTLSYRDLATKLKVEATSITAYQRDGNVVRFGGTCRVNKTDGFTFTVVAEDNGSGSTDRFTIELSNGYRKGGVLSGGDISISE